MQRAIVTLAAIVLPLSGSAFLYLGMLLEDRRGELLAWGTGATLAGLVFAFRLAFASRKTDSQGAGAPRVR